jgi:hypothetical protein
VAGVSVVSSVWLQRISMKEQAELKHYEVDLLPKQRAYSTFSVASASAVSDVVSHDKQDLLKQFLEMESALSSLESFLSEGDRIEVRLKYADFVTLCNAKIDELPNKSDAERNDFASKASRLLADLKNRLFDNLFRRN